MSRGFRCWMLEKGKGELFFGTDRDEARWRRHLINPGEWWLIPHGFGRQNFSPDSQIVSISFVARWPTGEPLFTAPEPAHVSEALTGQLRRCSLHLARRCEHHSQRAHQHFSHDKISMASLCRVNASFYNWLDCFVDVAGMAGWEPNLPGDIDPRLATAFRILSEQPLSLPFRVENVARACGLSVSQLNRLFRQYYRQTPASYFDKRRRDYARMRVETEAIPLKEISFELGFSAPSHFTPWFCKVFGKTPSRWRKEHVAAAAAS
ncbi:MAG: AraC family transcriptional regulator [Opitutaceae bacterium]|nr:AraC family transcriptional regulator [Opitutaceae bacterium]